MTKRSCVIYDSWGELFIKLPNETAGKLIKAISEYCFKGDTKTDDPVVDAMFSMIKAKLDEDSQKYLEKVERLKANTKRNRDEIETISERNRDDISGVSDSVSVSVYVSDKDKRKKFVRPTLEEVRSYCQERNNQVDPEAFIDFYESKGWKVGNQPMKDWKSAIRTWERRENNKSSPSGISQQTYDKIHNHKERRYDYEALMKEVLNV